MAVDIDDRDFKQKSKQLLELAKKQNLKAVNDVANEILRISVNGPPAQVPHDLGQLQNSASVQPFKEDEVEVGFNKVYAARLHEHPEYMFQKNRKGKYLEDPIKNNLPAFQQIIAETLGQIITP